MRKNKPKKKLKRIVRQRKLTKKKTNKYDSIRKQIEKKFPPQRWTRGTSTFDGQKCDAWFNVTNWH